MSRLVVVSNRVPASNNPRNPPGGLVVALQDTLAQEGGLWFGWSGRIGQGSVTELQRAKAGAIDFATVDLSRTDYNEYYNGFANRCLWPVFHYRVDLASHCRRHLEGYMRVNALFAKMLEPLLDRNDCVWVHDYHLIPIGEMLRDAGVSQRLGFFLHTPLPPTEILTTISGHEKLMRGLCAYDVLGFQTASDLRHFREYIRYEADGEVHQNGTVRAFGQTLRADVFPIGIDVDNIVTSAKAAIDGQPIKRLREALRGREIIVGVDRLDYSKGLVERFLAFEEFLEQHPGSCARVVFLQIAPPTRAEVPEYKEIRAELEGEAGRINGQFGEPETMPLIYLNKAFRRSALAGYFRIARAGLVTPLRDGMNLVAKEYVTAQDPEDPGALVLSRFAGAAEQLSSALIVNPYDTRAVADAIHRAITMSGSERKERWQDMMRAIKDYDLIHWRNQFLKALRGHELNASAA